MVRGYCWGVAKPFSISEPSTRADSGLSRIEGAYASAWTGASSGAAKYGPAVPKPKWATETGRGGPGSGSVELNGV